jgi:predicted 2-oxoglutarate/Fe(II)-dependent dioxygenase YbiX
MIVIIDSFILKNDLEKLRQIIPDTKFVDGVNHGAGNDKYSSVKIDEETGVTHYITTAMVMEQDAEELFKIVRSYIPLVKSQIERCFETSFYDEPNFGITVYTEGTSLPSHFDGEDSDAEVYGILTPNGNPRRDVSSVLYLSDDFDGGELIFKNLNLTIKPKAGMLILFPGAKEYTHEVTKITRGTRFIVPQFWAEYNECL